MSPGNADQRNWTEMKANPTYYEEPLRDGVPLFWTVRLTDDFGNQAMSSCKLDTYDMTVPEGWTKWYPTSSSRVTHIRANLEVCAY